MSINFKYQVFGIATLLAGLTSSLSAVADTTVATLSQIEGKVMVNTGTTFEAATAGQKLQPGYKIVVPKGSTVKISYSDGCVIDVTENTSYVVKSVSDCPVVAGETGTSQTDPLTGEIIGGTLLLGATIAVIANDDDDDDDISPASPPP